MAMEAVEITVTGISPLLMHRFPMEPIEALEKKPIKEQAEVAAYRDEQGGLYVPGVNVQRALVAAASFSKGKGRASLQKVAAACLMVSPQRLDLGTADYIIDSRPVVIPSTKGRIVRHRPCLEDWEITFTLEWDDTLLSKKQVRQIVDDMGMRVGLLDFRPERKGPFGRCKVTNWQDG